MLLPWICQVLLFILEKKTIYSDQFRGQLISDRHFLMVQNAPLDGPGLFFLTITGFELVLSTSSLLSLSARDDMSS